jgi:hypothetical protein
MAFICSRHALILLGLGQWYQYFAGHHQKSKNAQLGSLCTMNAQIRSRFYACTDASQYTVKAELFVCFKELTIGDV